MFYRLKFKLFSVTWMFARKTFSNFVNSFFAAINFYPTPVLNFSPLNKFGLVSTKNEQATSLKNLCKLSVSFTHYNGIVKTRVSQNPCFLFFFIFKSFRR
jgi:hypothetical protein